MKFLPAFIGLCLILGACTSRQPGNVSEAELTDLSREQHAVVLKSFGGVYGHRKLKQYVEAIVHRLQQQSKAPPAPLFILNTNDVNGFSLPTGHIYVTRGLIALANDESELASVLAHEIAHVELNHAKQRVDMMDVTRASLQAIKTSEKRKYTLIQENQARLAQFSRKHEEEADHFGVNLSARAGYDPEGALRILSQLNRHQNFQNAWFGLSDDTDNHFLASHPSTPVRKRKLEKLIQSLSDKSTYKGRQRHLEAIEGMVYEELPRNGLIRGQNYFDLKRRIGFTVPKHYRIASFNDSIQALHPKGTALRYDHFVKSLFDSKRALLLKHGGSDITLGPIDTKTQGNLTYLTATATADDWLFALLLVIDGSDVHRFMIAGQSDERQLTEDIARIMKSFRKLSKHHVSTLGPRRIKLYKAKSGDTVAQLAKRMHTNQSAEQTFRVLNGLNRLEPLVPGQMYKLITDPRPTP